MKSTFLPRMLMVCLFCISILTWGNAQEETETPTVYADIACIKAKDEGLYEWVMDKGKAWNEHAQEKGIIDEWLLFQSIYPNGDNCECDMMSVTIFTSMAQLDKYWDWGTGAEVATEAFGPAMSAIWEQWKELGTDGGSVLYKYEASAMPGPVDANMSSATWLTIDPMAGQEFVQFEKDVWMPVAKKAIEAGYLKDYHIWSRMMPSSEEGNFITVFDYDDFETIESMNWEKISEFFKEAHPDADMMEMMKKSREMGELHEERVMKLMTKL